MMTETRHRDRLITPDLAAFLPDPAPQQPLIDLRDRPSPDILRLLAIGSPPIVNGCVITLYRLGYARPEEWSRPLPTVNPNEVMRILTKRMILSEQE
ncbi:hypothetical protein [Nodosilinea sp. E11]|uniref:hypothetical protein n=1 Tax=Nodosilinea sp. E11 TaxID=3037479 RepID=UPI00293501D6|nr:hypothetical protein [Nodosilinea sp. E11]WOD40438.1 hypothetical protein RRF56_06485 [Nodosilinea sp. E11]